MWKRIAVTVVGLLVVVGVLGGIKAAQVSAMIEAGEKQQQPPQTVSSATVSEETWAPSLNAVGTLVATREVVVAAEVPGMVRELVFDSGQKVARGAVLVRMDTAIERAQLAAAQAQAELAEATLKRTEVLAKDNINTPAELDRARADAAQSRAQVQLITAQIAKKTIRAHFAGRLGIRKIDPGQYLSPGAPIVTLTDVDRVYADFFLPQQQLARVDEGQPVKITTEARDRTWTGQIETIEPSVEVATRNVRVRAVLDNADGALRPGMFVEVRVVLPEGEPTLVVPATAVVYAPYGDSIYVVEDAEKTDGKVARQVFVKLGERRGDFVSVRSGLSKGQTVVSTGAFKLKNGGAIVVDDDNALDPKLDPKPRDS